MTKKPVRVFLFSMAICSILEYLTSFFLERRFGIKWWDYSSHFLNVNGRICLLGAVVFGLGGAALVCLYLPFFERLYNKIPVKWRIVISLLALAAFAVDGTYCAMKPNAGEGISYR